MRQLVEISLPCISMPFGVSVDREGKLLLSAHTSVYVPRELENFCCSVGFRTVEPS
jgi:hypothetical protein